MSEFGALCIRPPQWISCLSLMKSLKLLDCIWKMLEISLVDKQALQENYSAALQ